MRGSDLRVLRMLVTVSCGIAAGCAGAQVRTETAGSPGEPSWIRDADDALADDMREIARQMSSAGLRLTDLSGRGFLANRDGITQPMTVPAGRCLTIVARASSGVGDMDATLYTPAGEVLAEDVQPDAHPTLQVCGGDEDRRVYYRLHAYEGAGAYLYAAFEGGRDSFEAAAGIVGGRPGVALEIGAPGELPSRFRELVEGLGRRGFEPKDDPRQVPLAEGQRVRVPLRTESGHCYTVYALAGPGLESLKLRVLDELGEEVATDGSGARDAATQWCARRPGELAAEVQATGGAGPARVVLFAGPSAKVGGETGLWLGERRSSARARRPLEERTILARLGERGWRPAPRLAKGRLAESEAVAHPVTLASGRCTTILALGGRGTGRFAARLVDEAGGVLDEHDIDDSAKPGQATLRVCPATRVRARVELVARGGGGDYAIHVLTKSMPADLPSGMGPTARGALLDAIEDAALAGWEMHGTVEVVELPARRNLDVPAQHCDRIEAVAAGEGALELARGEGAKAVRSGGRRTSTWLCGPAQAQIDLRGRGSARAYWVRLRRERGSGRETAASGVAPE